MHVLPTKYRKVIRRSESNDSVFKKKYKHNFEKEVNMFHVVRPESFNYGLLKQARALKS